MHNATTHESEGPCANTSFPRDFDNFEAFPTKAAVCALLPPSLALTLLFAVAIYKKVEVGHPVFAVIMQVNRNTLIESPI